MYNPDSNTSKIGSVGNNKVQEAYQQLASLHKVLTENTQEQTGVDVRNTSYENELPYPTTPSIDTTQLQRLENLTKQSPQDDEPDSEMLALNSMLDKVLDIQHPQRWKNKEDAAKSGDDALKALAVQPYAATTPISSIGFSNDLPLPDSLASDTSNTPVGFYGLSKPSFADSAANNMQAIIYKDQEIVSGATVQLMLVHDIVIGGVLIPKNSFVFGKASLQGERLEIDIPGIRYRDKILPVRLSVYDLDGLKGIYIPGAINRDASKQGADRAIQSIGLSSLNPSVSAQAAAAGIETAKNFLSKKVKRIRVWLKAGYRVLLLDETKQ